MAGETEPTDVGPEQADKADNLRRKILKAGAASLPAIVSLQSGTAWALSSCASRPEMERPTVTEIRELFSNATNREFVYSVTDIPIGGLGGGSGDDAGALCPTGDDDGGAPAANTLEAIICECTASNDGDPYPETSGADNPEACEIVHLLVTNGSCWASYCNGPIAFEPISITNNTDPSVCNGA